MKEHQMVNKLSAMLSFVSFFYLLILSVQSSSVPDSFIHCLSDNKFPPNISILNIVYGTANSSYETILDSTIANLRFSTSSTPKPLAIITPLDYSHVQATVTCCTKAGLQLRIRSGGHDFEGMSYRSLVPFVILDLRNLRSITIDIEENSAWVESGATIGELYYSIAEVSPALGFPAGVIPHIGVGGHFSGGGIGNLGRKHGLAADNVIDAIIVDVHGRILDKKSMGSDLFWAIRGGGGASFGVVLSWKIKLVPVPTVVTVSQLCKTFEQGAVDLVHKWQYVGPNLKEELTICIDIRRPGETSTLHALFSVYFLGRVEELLETMDESFPELQLKKEDCLEMSWIESMLYFSEIPGDHTIEIFKNRSYSPPESNLKVKSDIIQHPLPHEAIEELWKWGLQVDIPWIHFQPYGGIMGRISESETPFPHRKGVLCEIMYIVVWLEDKDGESSEKYINQVRGLYESMTPYVLSRPRGTYLNSRDLDLGINGDSGASYSKAEAWGLKYFKSNFKTLAIVKGKVDPGNFFHYEQSIPPLVSMDRNKSLYQHRLNSLHQCPSEDLWI